MAQLNHEPSMEDILASIKRIIAEDSEAAAPRAARPIRREMAAIAAEPVAETVAEAEFEPVTPEIEAAPEMEAAPHIDVAPAFVPEVAVQEVDAAPEAEPADVLELTSPIAEEVAPPVRAKTQPKVVQPKVVQSRPAQPESVPSEPIQSPREPVVIMDRLLSDTAAQASRSAFAALTQLQVRAEAGQENTLEGLVSDLLRPMLREWLDRELPSMVERMVADEIGRVSGRA